MASYKKLVRDKIPDIIKSNGEEPIYYELDEQSYQKELYQKLNEEVGELNNASSSQDVIEESADVLEVLVALTKLQGYDEDYLFNIRNQKKAKRGGFDKRIYLDDVKK